MIQYLKRKDVDTAKYDACIEKSVQSRIYAFSWYLDIVADYWDVLVLDDYKAVMPLPFKQKFLIKYVTQPSFSQQLGIFSKDEISEENQQKFIAKIPKKYAKVSLVFNAKNHQIKNNTRLNYILNLLQEYQEIKSKFSKGRKHAIKVAQKNNLSIKSISIEALIKIHNNNYSYSIEEEKLQKLVLKCISLEIGEVLGVYKNETLLGGGFFIKSAFRITYLYASFTADGRKFQAGSFLLNWVIQNYSNTNFLLDFEGGNLPNIGKFYRSFGSEKETYSFLERTLL